MDLPDRDFIASRSQPISVVKAETYESEAFDPQASYSAESLTDSDNDIVVDPDHQEADLKMDTVSTV